MSKIKSLLEDAELTVTEEKIVVSVEGKDYEFKSRKILEKLGFYAAEEPVTPNYVLIHVSVPDEEHGSLRYIELLEEKLAIEHLVKIESMLYNKGSLSVGEKVFKSDIVSIEAITDSTKISPIVNQYGYSHDDFYLQEYLRMDDCLENMTKARLSYFNKTFEEAIKPQSDFLQKYIK